jgi:hypothetical protein
MVFGPIHAGNACLGATNGVPHFRHPGAGRDLTLSKLRTGEIPACAGMTME